MRFQPWQVRWLETRGGRTRPKQRSFPDRHQAHAFADELAGDPERDAESIRVVPNKLGKGRP